MSKTNQDRVLAYEMATTLGYEELAQVSGGNSQPGGYLTIWSSLSSNMIDGKAGIQIDTQWDN